MSEHVTMIGDVLCRFPQASLFGRGLMVAKAGTYLSTSCRRRT